MYSLHLQRRQLGKAQHQPLGAFAFEANVYPGAFALAFGVEDHAFAKYRVVHPLTEA